MNGTRIPMSAHARSLTVFTLVGGLLVAGLAGSPAQAAPLPEARQVVVPAAGGSKHGNFVVREDNYGSTLLWSPDTALPMGGARPELFLDGKLLGAPLGKGGTLTLRVPGLRNAKARSLSAVSGGRVLDGPTLATPGRPAAAQTPASLPALVKVDPGKKGKYGTESFTYTQKSIKLDGFATKSEMKAQVVAPKGAKGKRPVVLMLHGRHGTCYSGSETYLDWPCAAGNKPIHSYRGYATQQQLLASQGYITVSISANSINAQDAEVADAGSGARAELVRTHLKQLAAWNNGAAATADIQRVLRGHMNMKQVMTVGHSRGGEGVNRAAVKAGSGDPFKIVGQVLIAPTDFGRQVAVGTPTTVILPYCDGDVSDLQGQQYVDQGARIATGDNSLKSSVLMMGANHNYFNNYWTPGATGAPADDDWGDPSDASCGTSSKQRLSPADQRAAGATYVAAAARTYLSTDTSAISLLDGTGSRAASAGPVVVHTAATGGKRRAVIRPDRTTKFSVKGNAKAVLCDGFSLGDFGTAPCSVDGVGASPHWLPVSGLETQAPSPQALRFSWTKAGSSMQLTAPRDLGTYRNVDLRVIADPAVRKQNFTLLLRDTSGRSVNIKPVGELTDLPAAGGMVHYWGQNMRFVIPAKSKVDVRKLVSLSLVGTSGKGKIYLLDGFASSSGLRASTASATNVARFNVKNAVIKGDPKQAEQVGYVSVPVSNSFTRAARVWIEVSDLSAYSGYSGRAYTVRPGQREIKVPVTFAGDDVYVDDSYEAGSGYGVTVTALSNAVTDQYTGSLAVKSAAARPKLSVAETDVVATAGGMVRWTVELSAPMGQDYTGRAIAVKPRTAGSELTLASAVSRWVALTIPGASQQQTFSQAGVVMNFMIPAYSTRATIEVPIRSLAKLGSGQQLELLIEADRRFVIKPITLRAKVLPGGSR